MLKLIFEKADFILKFLLTGDDELVDIVQNDDDFSGAKFLDQQVVEGEIKVGHLIEFVSEHIAIFDPEKIDKMVDVENLSLEKVGGCFDCEGGLSYSWETIDEEGVVLIILEVFHEVIEFLLPTHHSRVLNSLVMFDQFGSSHRNNLSTKGDIFLDIVDTVSILSVLGKYFELITFAMRNSRVTTVFDTVFKEVEATADQQFYMFSIRRKVGRQFRFLFRESVNSIFVYSEVIIDVMKGKLGPLAFQLMLVQVSQLTSTFYRRNMIYPMSFLLSHGFTQLQPSTIFLVNFSACVPTTAS